AHAAPTAPAAGGAGTVDDSGLDRIWTVPNLLSVGRLALVGIFLWLLFGEHERIAATVVLMVTGTTDFLDGYVARRLHQVTTLGKVLDPTADRIVLGAGVIAIAAYGAVPWWLAGVVLGREVVVSAAVLALAAIGARRIDVLWVGKAGTFGLMGCFPLFLLGDSAARWARDVRDVTWVLLVPALAFSLTAALAYIPLARRALAERSAPPTGVAAS
ncbi:MAG: CDP-alcohol phosphatidyltransferase family protein, partial [Acidimicrobiales bacterium]